jgi:23S rRNA (guanosine2251-2'-O)-methyltransferase
MLDSETDPVLGVPRQPGLSVLLDNIRSAWNVGSILRSADGMGFSHAFLCGYTPPAENAEVRKTSLGAEQSISWSTHRDALQLAHHLRYAGLQILAIEWTVDAVPISDLDLAGFSPESLVLAVGSEVTGIDPGILEIAEHVAYIPMQGLKRSFNVAVAFGVAAYQVSRMIGRQARHGP